MIIIMPTNIILIKIVSILETTLMTLLILMLTLLSILMILITTSLLVGFFLGMSMSYAMIWFNPSTILRHYFTNSSVRWGVDDADATNAAYADATNAAYAIQATTSICQSVSVDKVINADATDAADAIQATTSIC